MSANKVNKLVAIALWGEACDLLSLLGAVQISRDLSFRSLHIWRDSLIVVTGLGQHNMTAACSAVIRDYPSIEEVVNYGTAGAYIGNDLNPGELVEVSQVSKWDLYLDIAGFENQIETVDLESGVRAFPGLRQVTCNSGCSFSKVADRSRITFPCGDIEDMELYGLAVLSMALGMKCKALKLISNHISDETSSAAVFEHDFQVICLEKAPMVAELLSSIS